ncbi:MAG TPA: hypothetical protein VGH87_05380 [Polyangiaceae bacterium]
MVALVTGCVSDDSNVQDSGTKDQSVTDSGGNDGTVTDGPASDGDAAAVDPTWTVALPARSALYGVATDNNGNVYVAGQLQAPLSLAPINIASTQGLDVFIAKFDGKTKLPVWGVTYGGAGDDVAYGLAWTPNGLFITGTSNGASAKFGSQTVIFPSSNGTVSTHSFFARIDPSDGSVGWAISPDANRATYLNHSSFCWSVAGSGASFSIGCNYTGASFSWDASHFAWDTGGANAYAVFHFTDALYGPTAQWTKSLACPTGTMGLAPAIAMDAGGDTWVGGTFRGATAALKDEPSGTQILAGTANANPFVLKIANGTQAIAPAMSWAADSTNLIPTTVWNVVATPSRVFAGGQFITNGANGNFGKGAVTSQGFDMYALGLGTTALDTQWAYTQGGAGLDAIHGLASDGTTTYAGISWGSPALMFGATTLPDPASSTVASGIGKIDNTGAPVSALAVKSAAASVRVWDVRLGPSAVYAVGYYGGDTTWDDGTNATGNSTDGNGFMMRRPKF